MIAIDGPAGSGKSSTARAVAKALGFAHVDSGAVYRAVTLAVLEGTEGITGIDGARAVAAAREKGLVVSASQGKFRVTLGGKDVEPAIRSAAVTAAVSRISALREVREYVNSLLREAAADGGVVMDGRDIGTVVFPDAEVKVFLVADAAERARRRLLERGEPVDAQSVTLEARRIEERDRADSSRDLAPLASAEGAVHLDTTRLSFEEQVARIVSLVRGGPAATGSG